MAAQTKVCGSLLCNRSVGLMVPGVQPLQETFTHDWHYTTRQDLLTEAYFPLQHPVGDHVVQTVPSGPDQVDHVMHQLLFAAVSAARLASPML